MEPKNCDAQSEERTHTQDIHEMAPKCHLSKAHAVLRSFWAQQRTYNPEPAGLTWVKNCTSCCILPV